MFKKIFAVLILAKMACHGMAAETTATPSLAVSLSGSQQLLLVTTKDWDAVAGTMRRFARTNINSTWQQVGVPIPVVVGRHGLGWGRGLNPPFNLPGPVKKEGDGKSPAGIFRLSTAFGLAAPEAMKNIRLPYRQLTDAVECVDDEKSTNYNSIVNRDAMGKPDWNSSEKMRAVGEQYRLGVVVDHNTDPRQPGGGSCIFIHIWQDAATGTSGCTAMAPSNIEPLLSWLDPKDNPVLAQFPESAYKKLKSP